MKNKRNCLFVAMIVVLALACTKNTDKAKYNCNNNSPVIRVVSNEKGKFVYLKSQEIYAINVSSGVDNQIYYILCSSLSITNKVNDSVLFSGNIRASDIKPELGGQEYYELELSDIANKENIK